MKNDVMMDMNFTILEPRNEEINAKKTITVKVATYADAKKKLEKIQVWRDY